ncbi:hypothetical protein P1J78_25000, partial [Psychromarinibacter sp. C21-152]
RLSPAGDVPARTSGEAAVASSKAAPDASLVADLLTAPAGVSGSVASVIVLIAPLAEVSEKDVLLLSLGVLVLNSANATSPVPPEGLAVGSCFFFENLT